MWWNWYKIVFFLAIGVVVVCGIFFHSLNPEHQEMVSAAVQIIGIIVIMPVIIVVGDCLADAIILLCRDLVREIRSWRKERGWGHIFTIPGLVGLVVVMSLDGPDVIRAHQETDIKIFALWGATSFSLLMMGWFINHFPTSHTIARDWSRYDS